MSVRVLGATDPVMGWDGARAYLDADGAAGSPPPERLDGVGAATQRLGDGSTRLFRDRLGVGKLFWARGGDSGLDLAARPIRLIEAGHRLDDISALPRGCVVTLDAAGHVVEERRAPPPRGSAPDEPESLEAIGARIRDRLDAYLAQIAAAHPGRRAVICLSGGLDSSTIAAVARRHFDDLAAISFDIDLPDRGDSEDRAAARRLAGDLGMTVIEATVSPEALIETLDLVLTEGIDWRDFNVHAALVNAALGRAIREASAGDATPPLVLTGDLSNEYLADYGAERYRGATYYALPRLGPDRLRDILVQGLDTCHREVGIFAAHGLPLAQPFAVAADLYLGLPAAFLAEPDRKERLVRAILGDALPDYIYSRPKVRAQTGGLDIGGGVLGACIDRGIDADWLRGRFAELHRVDDTSALDRFIRAGRYRAAIPTHREAIHECV